MSIGATAPGAFAEYLALPAVNVWPADERIPLDTLAIFDPLGNAVHAALSFDLVGEDVLITGAGPVGCLAAAVVRHAGARHVVITDVNPARLRIAEKMGVSLAVDVRTSSPAEAMATLGMTEGFDVGLEMSGNKAALQSMIATMAHGGRIGLMGFLEGETPVELEPVIFRGLTLKGIYGREMFETWYKMTAMVQSGLDVTPVITHHFPVAEYEEAFAIMRSGRSGKIILEWPSALDEEGREPRQSGGDRDHRCRQGPAPAASCRTRASRASSRPSTRSTAAQGVWVELADGRRVLNMCANNYLNLSSHPEVVAAAGRALGGVGLRHVVGALHLRHAGGARAPGGDASRSFLGMEAAILYSSCFDANGGLFETLLGPEDAIVSDALNHASIIDGIRLCKAQRYRYRNCDMADLEAKLEEARGARTRADRHRRRVLHGRRDRAPRRRSATSPSATARSSWSTTRTRSACSASTAAARPSTTA